MKLFRPVNAKELQLIEDSGWEKFPPRLAQQPIFYPVLNYEYAKKINDWNLNSYGNGYIVEFEVNDEYISKFDIQNVGDINDNELWIPANELNEFNNNIIGLMNLINESGEE